MSFDITKHEWEDTEPRFIAEPSELKGKRTIYLSLPDCGEIDSDHVYINITEKDAIAIAKHFGIYEEPSGDDLTSTDFNGSKWDQIPQSESTYMTPLAGIPLPKGE